MANSEGLHENQAPLRPETVDRHRAFASLQEELEVADWYDPRAAGSSSRDRPGERPGTLGLGGTRSEPAPRRCQS